MAPVTAFQIGLVRGDYEGILETSMKPLLLAAAASAFFFPHFVNAANPGLEAVDEEEFFSIVSPEAQLTLLAEDFQFTEGPVWVPRDEGGYLLFSDIPANRIYRWDDEEGLSVFREPSHHANGNILDNEGRLVTAEHGSRRVTRTEADGSIVTLAEAHEGKRFNSPNDVAVKSDGSVWFTDPPYGLSDRSLMELDGHYVFRLDPESGEVRIVADGFDMPNGLCFSPDESKLYIADSGSPANIRVFEVLDSGDLSGGEVFCEIDQGVPDGIRVDTEGRLYSSAGDGIQVFSSQGGLIGRILVPQAVANFCFGGVDDKRLFMTARGFVYSIDLLAEGIR